MYSLGTNVVMESGPKYVYEFHVQGGGEGGEHCIFGGGGDYFENLDMF